MTTEKKTEERATKPVSISIVPISKEGTMPTQAEITFTQGNLTVTVTGKISGAILAD